MSIISCVLLHTTYYVYSYQRLLFTLLENIEKLSDDEEIVSDITLEVIRVITEELDDRINLDRKVKIKDSSDECLSVYNFFYSLCDID